MSRFLQVYEPDTGLMLTQESVDFMLSKSDPEFIVATEGFGDIMKKIWDAIVKFFKWLIEKIQKLYNRMKEFVKGLVKKKEQIKQEQKEREKKALDKIANDTVGGHEKAANELMDDLHKSNEKLAKHMAKTDKEFDEQRKHIEELDKRIKSNEKAAGGLKPKDYYDKRREEAHAEFKKADAEMMDALDKTAKATAAVHDAATSKKVEPPKPEPPKDESINIDGLIFDYGGSEFEHAIFDSTKVFEKVILEIKKFLKTIKIDTNDLDNSMLEYDDDGLQPAFNAINKLLVDYKIYSRTDSKYGLGVNGNNSMQFDDLNDLAKFVEKRLMTGCKELGKMLNKIVLTADEIAKKRDKFSVALYKKYKKYYSEIESTEMTDNEQWIKETFGDLRHRFKTIGEVSTRIYNAITHDYHKMTKVLNDNHIYI